MRYIDSFNNFKAKKVSKIYVWDACLCYLLYKNNNRVKCYLYTIILSNGDLKYITICKNTLKLKIYLFYQKSGPLGQKCVTNEMRHSKLP